MHYYSITVLLNVYGMIYHAMHQLYYKIMHIYIRKCNVTYIQSLDIRINNNGYILHIRYI